MAAAARMDATSQPTPQNEQASLAERHASHDIPALDGLRGLAVLLVIWCHVRGFTFTPATDGLLQFKAASGLVGLYLFFVLSGFLLFQPYARIFTARTTATAKAPRWPDVRRFYARRALRILPVFYTAILTTLLLATIKPSWGILPPVPSPPALLALFTLFHDDLPTAWQYILSTNTPLWSLAVEWQFYLVLPLIALGLRALHRRLGLKGVIAGLIALLVYALGIRSLAAATFYLNGYPNVMSIPGPFGLILTILFGMNGKFLELFALGMLAALAYTAFSTRITTALDRAKAAAQTVRPITILLLVSIFIGIPLNMLWLHAANIIPTPAAAYVGRWPQDAPGAWLWAILGSWTLALCMVGILLAAVLGPAWVRATLSWRPLRLVGLISYSLYVWHALVEKLWYAVWQTRWPTLPSPIVVTVYLILLALVGILSYRLIERPFLQLRKGRPLPIVSALKRLTTLRAHRDLPTAAPTNATPH